MSEKKNRSFEYLLNSMEAAGQTEMPADVGYGDKRKAVFAYVEALASRLERAEAELADANQLIGKQVARLATAYTDLAAERAKVEAMTKLDTYCQRVFERVEALCYPEERAERDELIAAARACGAIE